jgi:cytochrome c-type biogenesis protein CcmI
MWIAMLLFVAVAAAVLWFVAAPLLREDAAESERIVAANSEAVDLQSRHAMLIGALADLEEDRSTGKVDDADYDHLKTDLSGKAIAVLKKMDALANRPPEPPPGPRRLEPTGDKTA